MNGSGSVLVVGGGIAGIQSSLDLAEAGFKVNLVESSPTIGGIMAQLDKTFPTNDCAMCIMSPKLVDCARHLNINLMTLSEVQSVSGEPGNFTVQVHRRARYVDEDKCTGCGECEKHCPVTRPNDFDERLAERKAIYRPFPQAAPNVFAIEKKELSPCTAACPAGCNAHGYVSLIREKKFKEAVELIRQRIPLPAICGRVCGLCEDECNRSNLDDALQIRALKRFAADWEMQHPEEFSPAAVPSGKKKAKVAIIGAGPAGLTAAWDLSQKGYQPVIFEAQKRAGGMVRYGIPEYRLPDDVLDHEVQLIEKAGVEIRYKQALGKDMTLEGLFQDAYKAVFLATGTHESRKMMIEGEQLKGVIPALEFLRQSVQTGGNGNKAATQIEGKVVAVIGGGNTAVDAVRTARRLGAKKAMIVYRRTREQMPAQREEIEAAEAEGIKLHFLRSPREIVGKDGWVKRLVCDRMHLGPPDDSDRRRPLPNPGESESFQVDVVIPALGQEVNQQAFAGSDLAMDRGLLRVDTVTLQTSTKGVFAGGDVVGAGGYVVHAIAHGHAVAESIDRFLSKKDMAAGRVEEPVGTAITPQEYQPRQKRVDVPTIEMKKRLSSFHEVEIGYTEEQAVAESERCLNCGVCCECKQCEAHCEADAIDHTQTDELIELKVGSILLASGCEKYNPDGMHHLGYGATPDVVTSIQFERLLSASGPFGGHMQRPSDGKFPTKVAFVQCVGSRDPVAGNDHCSSVCCMYAIKEAVIAKEHDHEIEPTIFYMDIRAHGKDFDRYVERAKNQYGIRFKKARVSGIVRDPDGSLLVEYEDEAGRVVHEHYDLAVLSIGFQAGDSVRNLAEHIGLPVNRQGFIASEPFDSVATRIPGIYACGPVQEPKDIPETVMQASAAAAAAGEVLSAGRWSEVQDKVYPDERDVSQEDLRVGIFVCHCGINIGGTVAVPDLVTYSRNLPNVVFAEENLYTCSQDTQEHIKEMITEYALNRVIVTSCTPRTHEPLFQETIREAGLNRHLFGMANIRDQCSWIHMDDPEEATEKAKDLLRMTVAKIRLVEPLPTIPLDVDQSALIIGGGPAGMACALSIANQGYPVDLIEKDKVLGGNLRHIYTTIEGRNARAYLQKMVDKINGHDKITVHLKTEVEAVEGFVGQFKSTLQNGGDPEVIEHGVAVIATGASESKPQEYLYGQDQRIKTGQEFEHLLNESTTESLPERIAFIQCVGSREEEHQYCSRICCRETIKNALALKTKKPSAEVYVLYRDMRTYGFSESYYQQAREVGVMFFRYESDQKPILEKKGQRLQLSIQDIQSNARIVLEPDMIILAARIDAEKGNEAVSQLFKVPLNQDGFFLEAHVKLRPVDFATDGVFLAGMAHNPKTIEESIAQGKAAAARAATIISKDKYLAEATIAAVNEELCDGCGMCVGVCEYNALEIVETPEGGKIVKLNEAACKGCGCCVAACPSGAMEQKGYKTDQILAEIDAALM